VTRVVRGASLARLHGRRPERPDRRGVNFEFLFEQCDEIDGAATDLQPCVAPYIADKQIVCRLFCGRSAYPAMNAGRFPRHRPISLLAGPSSFCRTSRLADEVAATRRRLTESIALISRNQIPGLCHCLFVTDCVGDDTGRDASQALVFL